MYLNNYVAFSIDQSVPDTFIIEPQTAFVLIELDL